jgi:hypothetical protein
MPRLLSLKLSLAGGLRALAGVGSALKGRASVGMGAEARGEEQGERRRTRDRRGRCGARGRSVRGREAGRDQSKEEARWKALGMSSCACESRSGSGSCRAGLESARRKDGEERDAREGLPRVAWRVPAIYESVRLAGCGLVGGKR